MLYYSLDKEYSRKASGLAISQLLNEINVLREPQQAVRRFKFVVLNPGIYLASMLAAEVGDEEEPFEQYLERINRLPSAKEDGVFLC